MTLLRRNAAHSYAGVKVELSDLVEQLRFVRTFAAYTKLGLRSPTQQFAKSGDDAMMAFVAFQSPDRNDQRLDRIGSRDDGGRRDLGAVGHDDEAIAGDAESLAK